MKESSLSHILKIALTKLGILFRRIEDACTPGTPDVYLRSHAGSAWVELKYVKEWPKRPATLVRIEHFSPEQKLWLLKEGQSGGLAWVFIQVADDYLLFDWKAAQGLGGMTKSGMLSSCVKWWKKPCNWEEVGRLLLSSPL